MAVFDDLYQALLSGDPGMGGGVSGLGQAVGAPNAMPGSDPMGYMQQGWMGRWQSLPSDPALTQTLTDAAEKNNLNPADLATSARIESGYNPQARNGQHAGLFQMTPQFAAQWGVQDRTDPMQASEGAARAMSAARDKLASALGGGPVQPSDLYLMHQQGPSGGRALMNAAPGALATSVRPPSAIASNLPPGIDPATLTAQDFRDLHGRHFHGKPMALGYAP